jgi:hypothetical protein
MLSSKRKERMYEVKFYRDRSGKSEIVEYLDDLKGKSLTSKTDRINHDKILYFSSIGKIISLYFYITL